MNGPTTVRFTGVFQPNQGTSQTQYALDMFSVFVTNLVTPRSTAPTSSFKVRIYDSLGNLQYKRESQAFSAVAQAQPFGKVVLLRSSQMNNAMNTTYDFLMNIS